MKYRLSFIAAAVTLLQGCATQSAPTEKTGADTEFHAQQLIVARSAEAIRVQKELFALLAEDKSLVLQKQGALDTDLVDIDYIGKPQALLDAIATRYRYRYVESGKRSELATVQVRANRETVKEALRSIGNQVDTGADVVLDQQARVLRLVYKTLN